MESTPEFFYTFVGFEYITFFSQNTWFLFCLATAGCWAVLNILDVFLTGSGRYREAMDGTIVSAVFPIFVWMLPALGIIPWPDLSVSQDVKWVAMGAGVLFTFSSYFYFRSLFALNDSVIAETLFNVSIVAVPFFAFFLIGEVLEWRNYVGIGLAGVSALILTLSGSSVNIGDLRKVFFSMALAVICLSLAMVSEEYVYERLGEDFWTGYLFFTMGSICTGIILWMFLARKGLSQVIWENKGLFTLNEVISVSAMMLGQRAIDLAPAVSYVAVMDGLQPVFTMILAVGIVLVARLFRLRMNSDVTSDLAQQFRGFGIKIIASVVMIASIAFVVLE